MSTRRSSEGFDPRLIRHPVAIAMWALGGAAFIGGLLLWMEWVIGRK